MHVKNQTVSIIGAGRLGGALALALSRCDFSVENIVARSDDSANIASRWFTGEKIAVKPRILRPNELPKIESEIVLIATQDAEIEDVSAKLAATVEKRTIVLHCSGALSSDILRDHEDRGSMHPLVSISDAESGSTRFSGAFFCIEGKDKARSAAETIATRLGAETFTVETAFKPLYHASAVMASGHVVALLSAAVQSLSRCGPDPDRAKQILFPLIKSTIANLQTRRFADALTGTFARKDIATMENHIRSMNENLPPELTAIYLQLGLRSLHLVEERDPNSPVIDAMREKISLAKRNLKC